MVVSSTKITLNVEIRAGPAAPFPPPLRSRSAWGPLQARHPPVLQFSPVISDRDIYGEFDFEFGSDGFHFLL